MFMKMPWGFDQGTCQALLGIPGGMALACSRAAFRLRLINKAIITPASNRPSRTAMAAAISGVLSDELVGGVPVLLPPLFPTVEPLVVAVALLTVVGDALTVGVAPVVVAALAVTVAPGVGVTLLVVVGEGVTMEVGDGLGVGEGGTTGALNVKFVEDESVTGCPVPA